MTGRYLSSKPRYEILDGLRGVAAALVVCYHLLETYYGDGIGQPLNHGYLAVDFFFVLSGFVVGYAYDDLWGNMSKWNFFKRRIIRLHPMVVFGTFFGALMFYFGACDAFPLIGQTPWYMLLLIMVWCFTIVPLPRSMDIRGWMETNPLDGPIWSLQYEYLANVLYALFFRRLGKLMLAVCVAAFALLTVTLCLNIDFLGFLKAREHAAYTVIGGWSLSPDQLQIGLTRLLYPFFCGLLLSRCGKLIRVRGGFWVCSLLIATVLAMPFVGTQGNRQPNGIYEAVCILIVFPLIVSIGAGSSVTGSKSAAINNFLGQISYPLYITHYPLIYMQKAWAHSHKDAPLCTHVMVAAAVFALAIMLAYASLKLYETPVRSWLRDRLFAKNGQK